MGQTLTHGVYLPDEGERNCYSGLAANWQLLDGAVGTVAEHTTALAGKAPAVHTHTKSDITDFPAYGTTAGTICEGNDSRLSDARTPVAHTHVTADVTDLLSGDHTWTGDNTYSKTITVERSTDAGGFITAKNTTTELGSLPSSDKSLTLAFKDKNNDDLCYARVYYETTGGNSFRIFVRNKFASGAPSTSGTVDYAYFGLKINADKSKEAVFRANLRPYDSTNAYNLGDSTYKWKSFNGVNPGALSLPGTEGYTDIKGNITNLSGGDNTFTAPYDGWVCVKSANATVIHIINTNWAVCQSATQNTAGTLCCLCPVMSGQSFKVIVNATSLEYAYIHPCKGNV